SRSTFDVRRSTLDVKVSSSSNVQRRTSTSVVGGGFDRLTGKIPGHHLPCTDVSSSNAQTRIRVLKIRLRRTGARKRPSYRVVVAEATAPRDGRYIEIIGTYDPLTDPATITLNGDRAKHWLSVGAQPTD